MWTQPVHRHTLLEENVAVRHVSDNQRHLSVAVLEAGVSMKDMESQGSGLVSRGQPSALNGVIIM